MATRTITILSLVTAMLSLPIGASAACPLGNPSIAAEYRQSFAVFLGTVRSEQYLRASKELLEGTQYTVHVDETLRGKVAGRVRLFSENSTGRFPMQIGEHYLLFAYRDHQGRMMIDNCGNSAVVVAESPVLSAVRKLKP